MPAFADDAITGVIPSPIASRRPSWQVGILLDALVGVAGYLASYRLRFDVEQLTSFLPSVWSTVPIVLAAQLSALVITGAYLPRPGRRWLFRVVVGIALGTTASSLLVFATFGFEGVSRMAFAADALLFSIAAIGWRGVWVLRTRTAMRAGPPASSSSDLIDRAQEMTFGVGLGQLYSYRGLLVAIVLKDLKLKYRGSVFGFLWSLANPLLMIVVYTMAFTFILQIRNAMFVLYLMLGQLAWSFFANSAMMSTGSVVDNAGLLKTVLFPRAILPIGTVLFNFAQYLLTVSVFLPVMLVWYRVPLAAPMLLFPAVLALQVMFTIGISLILATATAFFRDVKHLVEVALAVLFWATPIVYELAQVPERLRLLILLSPLSPFVVAYEKLFFYREWPEATVWMVAIIYAVGALLAGVTAILAFEDRFTEQL